MRKVIVLMTALVPTIGHKSLVNYALEYAKTIGASTRLIISARSKEPTTFEQRAAAFMAEFFSEYNELLHIVAHTDDNAPQNPNPELEWDAEFWQYWTDTIDNLVGKVNADDVIVASEPYGLSLAKAFGCKFIPYDIDRSVLNTKGTPVRNGYIYFFDNIMPAFRRRMIKTVTIFGADSCGKTTTSKKLAKHLYGYFVPEWARPYLETVGPELTTEKMLNIVHGQYSLQKTVQKLDDRAFIIQDTDLFSTIGYYRILGWEVPQELIDKARQTKSDHYIVMSSDIPFVPDQLRYGGDKRESTDQFWIDILEEFNCTYTYVDAKNFTDRFEAVKDVVSKNLINWDLLRFKRD